MKRIQENTLLGRTGLSLMLIQNTDIRYSPIPFRVTMSLRVFPDNGQ